MFLAPREYLSFTYFSLQFIQKIENTTLCIMKSNNRINGHLRQLKLKKVLICTYTFGPNIQDIHEHINNISVYLVQEIHEQINLKEYISSIYAVWKKYFVFALS